MTWNDLARAIAQMTPEQRAKPVPFVEGYDAFAILSVQIEFCPPGESIVDENGHSIEGGEFYLLP